MPNPSQHAAWLQSADVGSGSVRRADTHAAMAHIGLQLGHVEALNTPVHPLHLPTTIPSSLPTDTACRASPQTVPADHPWR